MVVIVPTPRRRSASPSLFRSRVRRRKPRAEDSSPWQRDAHSATAAMLAGSRSGAVLLGGISRSSCRPGWKTYWRTPGDSGVPPKFRFLQIRQCRGSHRALAGADEIRRRRGRYIRSAIKQQVVLPLRIVAKNADKPVTLRAEHQLRGLRTKYAFRFEANAELGICQRGKHRRRGSVRLRSIRRAKTRQCRRPQSR